MIRSTRQLSPIAEVNLPFESLHGRVIRLVLWPLRFPDLTLCEFYWWESLKGKLYKTNSHTLEEIRSNIPDGFQQFPDNNTKE